MVSCHFVMNQNVMFYSFPFFPSLSLSVSILHFPSLPFSLLFFLLPIPFFFPFLPELLPPIISGESIVNKSGKLILDCNVFNSYPIASIGWFGPSGGDPLSRERVLIIPKLMRFNAGQYRCTVFGQRDRKNSYVNVTVQCKHIGQV